ncbi:malto-oligosyltrehalose trehalohydrolase [Gemmata sp. JC673]|uniref:Malto-oligosyltrehalose trehalohydrolase n=1 Tax=Gemmata algarum TaxID=2975278 RepID=A0ABU5F7R0_9BACT|nr:malto-oligosyltrehalose trehalohydrolase [Gemmata algarum]MDY3562363.1 malto-oligosyltrehalose trehalohydrolase [Gemmata algarum]
MASDYVRRFPVGAELTTDGTHFRVWAPIRSRVEVVPEAGPPIELAREPDGYFSGFAAGIGDGARYRLQLDGGSSLFPDPASRFQPSGPHGPSQVVDHTRFEWTDAGWPGITDEGQVLYELHIGTFTPEGTFAAAAARLPQLAELGVTAVEVMPVADFPGHFGWGYDGTCLFAPTRLYGAPDDFRRFVAAAHALGLGVILDVVYNHFGPDGNYIREFAPQFLSTIHKTEWGEPFNFDGPDSGPVREFFIANAAYWVEEFHIDGLRLDATQAIYDDSPTHVLTEIARRARAAAGRRTIYVMGENEPQDANLVRPPENGGCGLDAIWNDDLHHAARVALSGKNEGYFMDYSGTPQELVSAAKYGFLYQGQQYRWHNRRRGRPAFDIPRHRFVAFLENHDQVANSGRGHRVNQLTSPARFRALTAYLLLIPATPMLFQGQEYASTRPFLYFADHHPELAALVFNGRREAMRRFRSQAGPDGMSLIPDPADPKTFERSKLDPAERDSRPEWLALHTDLLKLRKTDPAFRSAVVDGAVLSASAFVLRFFVPAGGDRLLVVNLGRDLHLDPAPEPLLAPPDVDAHWHPIWSSEAPKYGGQGTAPLDTDDNWQIPGEAAVVLAARPLTRPT